MRPIDKGEDPKVKFKEYQDAQPYLEKQIGPYCSFCEFCIKHVPEVEHKEAKSTGGEELDWKNLLLSCKYCNTRKSTRVALGDKDKYLWPDEEDTFHTFSYEDDIPQLNEEYLKECDPSIRNKALELYKLLKLNNIPTSPKVKDKRYMRRNEARNTALSSLSGWQIMKDKPEKEVYLTQTILLAKETGFFSVWMEIFKNEETVKRQLIEAFPGTRQEFCQ